MTTSSGRPSGKGTRPCEARTRGTMIAHERAKARKKKATSGWRRTTADQGARPAGVGWADGVDMGRSPSVTGHGVTDQGRAGRTVSRGAWAPPGKPGPAGAGAVAGSAEEEVAIAHVPDRVVAQAHQDGGEQAVAAEADGGGEVEGVAVDGVGGEGRRADGPGADEQQGHPLHHRLQGR